MKIAASVLVVFASPALLALSVQETPSDQDRPQVTAETAATQQEIERAIAARVNDARAAAFVRRLVALGPRMGGTESGARAADLLEEEFAVLGLEVQRHLARKTWCHGEKEWSVQISIDGDEPRTIERVWPLGYSPGGSGSARLTLESSPEEALLASRYRGAKRGEEAPAVVIDDGRTTIDGAWPVCSSHPRRQNARTAVFCVSKPTGKELRDALADGKSVTVDWSLETEIEEAQPITVVATLEPRERARVGHVLICAHGDSDSGGPGANDNASGVAIVMEIARAWTAAIKAGDLEPPPIEVRFAIWGKEIHSTRDYLNSELGENVMAVLNFDQAGFGSTGQRLHVEPDDLQSNVPFVRAAVSVLSDHAGNEGFPERYATNKSLGGTDSYVFSGDKRFRSEGLPAVTMFTSAWGKPDEQNRTEGMPGESWRERDKVEMDYDVHYHSAGDTPENTTDKEPENMGWCARVGLLTVLRVIS